MVLPIRFTQSTEWNTGTSGPIGGTGVDTGVGTTLGDVFIAGVSDYVGQPTRHRFQKIIIEDTGLGTSSDITNPKVYFNAVKFPGQIELAVELTGGSTGDHPTGYPEGYTTGDFSTPIGIVNAIDLTGDLTSSGQQGIWLHQLIPANLPAETGATLTLGVIGEVP